MIGKEELKDSEMSYPLKINLLMRGAFLVPCPDCKTPHSPDVKDCDEWCLKSCVHAIDREILSPRQIAIHNQRRLETINKAMEMLSNLANEHGIAESEYRKRIDEITEHLKR